MKKYPTLCLDHAMWTLVSSGAGYILYIDTPDFNESTALTRDELAALQVLMARLPVVSESSQTLHKKSHKKNLT